MGVAVSMLTPIYFVNTSVVLNENNPGLSLNSKTLFVREHAATDVVEVRKIDKQ